MDYFCFRNCNVLCQVQVQMTHCMCNFGNEYQIQFYKAEQKKVCVGLSLEFYTCSSCIYTNVCVCILNLYNSIHVVNHVTGHRAVIVGQQLPHTEHKNKFDAKIKSSALVEDRKRARSHTSIVQGSLVRGQETFPGWSHLETEECNDKRRKPGNLQPLKTRGFSSPLTRCSGSSGTTPHKPLHTAWSPEVNNY